MSNTGRVVVRVVWGLLGLAAVGAAAWLLAEFEMPWAAACVLAIAAGWALWRFFGMSPGGLMLWCLTVVIMSLLNWRPPSADLDGLILLALATAPGSSFAFLFAAATDPLHRVPNCAGCVLAVFTLIGSSFVEASVRRELNRLESVQRTTQTIVGMNKLATEVESFRARLGRLPNERELVGLRGEPLPTTFIDSRLEYCREKGGYHVVSHFTHVWGLPKGWGWTVRYFGPESPRPFRLSTY